MCILYNFSTFLFNGLSFSPPRASLLVDAFLWRLFRPGVVYCVGGEEHNEIMIFLSLFLSSSSLF